MNVGSRYLIALIALAACESTGSGGGASKGGAKLAESGTKRGSAGGFAATLGAEIGAPEGSLGAAAPGAPSTAPTTAPSGSASPTVPAGSAAPAGSAGGPTGSATPSTAAANTTAANTAANTAGANTAANSAANAANPAAANTAAANTAAGSAAKPAPEPAPTKGAVTAPAKRVPVKPSAELAAIKFELEPNWERDIGEAGTFSLVVKVTNTEETRVFAVRYGYEDQAAPPDCDQYRKFLEDKKAMKVAVNRQRGAACYVEGVDASGVEAYRYMINYGGKRLMCHGSRYRDGASAALGDLRDKVLLQAKKICETMTL